MARYRVVADAFMANGSLCLKGAVVKHDGWPDLSKITPADDDAERIADYFRQRKTDPFLPKSPRDPRTGAIFLPAISADPRGKLLPSLPDEVTDEMPLYTVTAFDGLVFGGAKVAEGERVAFLGWPPSRLEPANEIAERVVSYRTQYSEHADFPECPWNLFTDALWLPALPEPEVEEARPAYVGAPSPKGFTPPAYTPMAKIPARTYSRNRPAPKYT